MHSDYAYFLLIFFIITTITILASAKLQKIATHGGAIK